MENRDETDINESWTLSEDNILIPQVNIIEGVNISDHIVTNSDTPSENSQIIGQTLVIGIDKNFFANQTKKNVLLFQNSGNSQGHSDVVNAIPASSYIISFVENEKDTNLRKIRRSKQDDGLVDNDAVLINGSICESLLRGDEVPPGYTKQLFAGELLADELRKKECSFGMDEENVTSTSSKIKEDLCSASVIGQQNHSAIHYIQKTRLPEKSLPIKKKAKMKSADDVPTGSTDTNTTENATTSKKMNEALSAEKIAHLLKKRKRGKRKCCYSDSELSDSEEELQDQGLGGFDINVCNSITDLVDDLRNQAHIDDSFAELILSGIREMKGDIFAEMQSAERVVNEFGFSYELMAFAFLLYFKKRPAYNYMLNGLRDRWPPKIKLDEWKRIVNSRPKNTKRNARGRKQNIKTNQAKSKVH